MHARLKDRNVQIPYGFKFKLAKTKWSPLPFSSFDTIVRQLQQHLQVNPAVLAELGWKLEYDFLADKVDEYNAAIAKAHGWTAFIIQGEGVAPPPKTIARSTHVANLAVGGSILTDWLGVGGVPVPKEVAIQRAKVCVYGNNGQKCPRNSEGGLLSYFTVAAAALIKKMLDRRHDMELTTPEDSELGVCVACDCPLKLKVWTPIEHIKAHLPEDQKARLVPWCWILAEMKP